MVIKILIIFIPKSFRQDLEVKKKVFDVSKFLEERVQSLYQFHGAFVVATKMLRGVISLKANQTYRLLIFYR